MRQLVKLRKNVEFYGSDDEMYRKLSVVEKGVDELYEEKERKQYIDSVLKNIYRTGSRLLSDLLYIRSTLRRKRQKFSVSLSLR